MKVAIIGSRTIQDLDIEKIVLTIPSNCSELVSGGAKGIDGYAKLVAERLGLPLKEFLPDYTFGKRGPLKRNIDIIQYADYVLAFWDYQSSGTRYTISECIKQKIPFKIYHVDDMV